jgi:PAS domain S-box-containing protein
MSKDDVLSRHLAKIVESSDDAIVSKDLNGNIISWNAAAERMFGYTSAEAVGRSIRMIIPADRQHEEDFVLGRIRAGEMVDHYETKRIRKDGTELDISLTISPILDDRGEVIGASKIARDITERTRLRAAARQQAQIAQQLSQIGAAVAASLDQGAIIQKVTDAAMMVTGAELGAFLYNATDGESGEAYMWYTRSGTPNDALGHYPAAAPTGVFVETLYNTGAVRSTDIGRDPLYRTMPPFPGVPAEQPPVRSYLSVPVRTSTGALLGGLFFGHSRPDVFKESHEQLAAGIAGWASLALENARLYREAREADRVKDEFLAVLSHELRTPLNAILGYTRLLRGRILSGEKAERGLETLERNATSLTQIVEDVLDVSRIVAGKIRLDVQPVDLPLVVHNAIETVHPAAGAKGVQLQAIVDPNVGPVSGDPDRLQQVVWNLLSNGVKFTPRDGRVQVRVQSVDSHVEIAVSDTGIGIRPSFLPYVFERFRQADTGTTRKAGGLGLGLSIVRHLVEMHGGSVHAQSDGEGRGATFTIRLPVMIVQQEKVLTRREHPRTEQLAPLTELEGLAGIRVMAIDDEEDALGLLRAVLEAAGAEVTTCSSAQLAIERIASVRPDVLVVDLGMPEMDGFQFISRVRSSPDRHVSDVPAAALTAFTRSNDRTRALRSGFEMHLAKPIDPGELVASLLTLARRAHKPR